LLSPKLKNNLPPITEQETKLTTKSRRADLKWTAWRQSTNVSHRGAIPSMWARSGLLLGNWRQADSFPVLVKAII